MIVAWERHAPTSGFRTTHAPASPRHCSFENSLSSPSLQATAPEPRIPRRRPTGCECPRGKYPHLPLLTVRVSVDGPTGTAGETVPDFTGGMSLSSGLLHLNPSTSHNQHHLLHPPAIGPFHSQPRPRILPSMHRRLEGQCRALYTDLTSMSLSDSLEVSSRLSVFHPLRSPGASVGNGLLPLPVWFLTTPGPVTAPCCRPPPRSAPGEESEFDGWLRW